MLDFLGTILTGVITGILPKFITELWEKFISQRVLKRVPLKIVEEAQFFMEIFFPNAPFRIDSKQCYYLPDSKHFFMEKVDILDSLEKCVDGEVGIICRVPWLVMPSNYRDIYLSSPEARAYYAMLERLAKIGKVRYLYNINSLNPNALADSITRGVELHCIPMLLQSTNFDVMIANTDRHRYKIILATRPIGLRDQEHAIVIQQKDIYSAFYNFFASSWNSTNSFWKKQVDLGLPTVKDAYLPLQPSASFMQVVE